MDYNGYSILQGFIALLRLGLGGLITGFALALLWRLRRAHAGEAGSYLLFLLAFLFLGITVVSWPLLYVVLQSYVPQLPGVMCIYGVTQFGSDSTGPSRYLPGLLEILQVTKPVTVFLAGAWLVLYLMQRGSPRRASVRNMLVALVALGALGCLDSAVEGAYLAIPKERSTLPLGCCFTGQQPTALSGFVNAYPASNGWRYGSYYGANLLCMIGLVVLVQGAGLPRVSSLFCMAGLAGVTLFVNASFLSNVVSPQLLDMPYHHCPYDLVQRFPEFLLGLALFGTGGFCVGWSFVARVWGGNRGRAAVDLMRKLLFLGLFCLSASLLFTTIELIQA